MKETGDVGILDVMVDFNNDSSLAAPFKEHLRRAFRNTAENLGPHGLPLIGRADWNDCLNLNCYSEEAGESFQTVTNQDTGVAESVFIAGMFAGAADRYAGLLALTGDKEEAAYALAEKEKMIKAVEAYGWDGEWFLRAYDANGDKVGSSECDEGKIFVEPQGMCVMAGIGKDNGMAQKALDSTRKHLLFEHGVMLNWPAYRSYHLNLGEISSYPPGYKENGSVFCHNNPWIVIAETELGHGDRAFDVYKRTAPVYIGDQTLHRTEPYVYCQTINGRESFKPGEARNSWLTGTAAYNFYAVSQSILGIKPQYDGLMIDPCLPAHLKTVTVRREFRGNEFLITILNNADGEKGRVSLVVDGEPLDGQTIPVSGSGQKIYQVQVTVD